MDVYIRVKKELDNLLGVTEENAAEIDEVSWNFDWDDKIFINLFYGVNKYSKFYHLFDPTRAFKRLKIESLLGITAFSCPAGLKMHINNLDDCENDKYVKSDEQFIVSDTAAAKRISAILKDDGDILSAFFDERGWYRKSSVYMDANWKPKTRILTKPITIIGDSSDEISDSD